MKIDVITLHNVKNYGSALQTYATQKTLEKLGNEVEIINYYRKVDVEETMVKRRIDSSSIFSRNIITKFIGKLFLTTSINKQIEVFHKFLGKYVHLTKKYYSNEELKKNTPKADIYCTGSDQVWNSEWNEEIDRALFLDFLENDVPRFAYASSFGKIELEKKEEEELKKMLIKYKRISVRENSALKILKKMGIDNAIQVLDPTLLLNKKAWKDISEEVKIKKPYILVYQLNSNNPKFDEYVKKLSKKKKMPVLRISNVNYQFFKYGKLVFCPTINEFLSYFDKAAYIVTDSFHATGFAINFNKKFVCIFPQKFSTRLQSILELTNLEERRVNNFNDLTIIDKEIEYEKVNKILDEERKKSINFIEETIKECIERSKINGGGLESSVKKLQNLF